MNGFNPIKLTSSVLAMLFASTTFAVEPWMPPRTVEEFDQMADQQYDETKKWIQYDPREDKWRQEVRVLHRNVVQNCKNPPMNLPSASGCASDLHFAIDYNGRIVSLFQTEDSELARCVTRNIKNVKFPAPLISPGFMIISHTRVHCP
tara:strand:+ start:3930 stop:4373 length:444 start_codon:yes stop_codon:yes gene_type:complete